MAIIARYTFEGASHTYPTIAQALMAEALTNCPDIFLEQYRIEAIIEHLDKNFVIAQRPKEEADETI